MSQLQQRRLCRVEPVSLDLDTEAEKRDAFQAVRSWVNFYLAFQGRDDRALQKQYAGLVERVMAACYPQWVVPTDMPPRGPGEGPKSSPFARIPGEACGAANPLFT